MTIEGSVADTILSAAEANRPAIIAAITSAEGGLESFLSAALENIKPVGLVGTVWALIKPALLSELLALEAKESGSVIFAFLDVEAHAFAKSLGG
jgi:hypothetical protein